MTGAPFVDEFPQALGGRTDAGGDDVLDPGAPPVGPGALDEVGGDVAGGQARLLAVDLLHRQGDRRRRIAGEDADLEGETHLQRLDQHLHKGPLLGGDLHAPPRVGPGILAASGEFRVLPHPQAWI